MLYEFNGMLPENRIMINADAITVIEENKDYVVIWTGNEWFNVKIKYEDLKELLFGESINEVIKCG